MKKLITIITVIVCLSFIPSIIYGISRSMFEKTRDGHVTAHAATSDEVILHGISVGPIDVSDLTVKQAEKKIDDFFAGLNSEKIVVKVNGNNEEFPVSDANLTWTNQEILEDIVRVGKEGNIIQRFKEIQDVERDSAHVRQRSGRGIRSRHFGKVQYESRRCRNETRNRRELYIHRPRGRT